MSTFHLRVIASNRVFYDGDCEQIVIPAIDGEMGILAHHERMVVAMTVGDMRFLVPDKDWQHAVVGIGFVNIEDNEVTVLADTVERPEDIDVRRAEAARDLDIASLAIRRPISLGDSSVFLDPATTTSVSPPKSIIPEYPVSLLRYPSCVQRAADEVQPIIGTSPNTLFAPFIISFWS